MSLMDRVKAKIAARAVEANIEPVEEKPVAVSKKAPVKKKKKAKKKVAD